jgi:hypothetical protein
MNGAGPGGRARLLARAFPALVRLLNRAQLGPLSPDLSPEAISSGMLAAMGEVAARLRLRDATVVFGHTHRAGPMPDDPPAGWRGPGGAALINCGSWVTGRARAGTPYSPEWVVLVGPAGPPRLRSLETLSRAGQA